MRSFSSLLFMCVFVLASCVQAQVPTEGGSTSDGIKSLPIIPGASVPDSSAPATAVESAPESLVNTNSLTAPGLGLAPKLDVGVLPRSSSSPFSPWRSMGAMLMVLGGLLAANVWLKKRRLAPGKDGQSRHIALVERFHLDHRRTVMLFDVDGHRVLVGAGPEGMRTLLEYEVRDGGSAAGNSGAAIGGDSSLSAEAPIGKPGAAEKSEGKRAHE